MGLRLLGFWDCEFESRWGMAVCCECYALSGREVSASDWSLDQRILSGVVSLSVIVKPLEKKADVVGRPKDGRKRRRKK